VTPLTPPLSNRTMPLNHPKNFIDFFVEKGLVCFCGVTKGRVRLTRQVFKGNTFSGHHTAVEHTGYLEQSRCPFYLSGPIMFYPASPKMCVHIYGKWNVVTGCSRFNLPPDFPNREYTRLHTSPQKVLVAIPTDGYRTASGPRNGCLGKENWPSHRCRCSLSFLGKETRDREGTELIRGELSQEYEKAV
jgi:hypothetical protein